MEVMFEYAFNRVLKQCLVAATMLQMTEIQETI